MGFSVRTKIVSTGSNLPVQKILKDQSASAFSVHLNLREFLAALNKEKDFVHYYFGP